MIPRCLQWWKPALAPNHRKREWCIALALLAYGAVFTLWVYLLATGIREVLR